MRSIVTFIVSAGFVAAIAADGTSEFRFALGVGHHAAELKKLGCVPEIGTIVGSSKIERKSP